MHHLKEKEKLIQNHPDYPTIKECIDRITKMWKRIENEKKHSHMVDADFVKRFPLYCSPKFNSKDFIGKGKEV